MAQHVRGIRRSLISALKAGWVSLRRIGSAWRVQYAMQGLEGRSVHTLDQKRMAKEMVSMV